MMTPCACLGKQGNDQFCPCVMEQLGLKPSIQSTPKEIIGEIFNRWSKENESNRVE